MSKPSRMIVVFALLVLGVACGSYLHSPAAAQEKKGSPPPAVTKWEYRIVVLRSGDEKSAEEELNKLGEEGFEIAFATGTTDGNARGSTGRVHYTLKRAKK